MIKKAALFSFLFVLITNVYAQRELDSYKYIIIPKKYDFLKRENQYRLNTLTKYLFDQEGFTTVLKGGAYPNDLQADPCLGVTADIVDESNLYKTKLHLVFINCHGTIVFTTIDGTSKIKQYDKTYIDALEKSFVSVKHLNYKYDPKLRQAAKSMTQTAAVAAVHQTEPETMETEDAVSSAKEPVSSETATADVSNQNSVEPVAVVSVPEPVQTESTGTLPPANKNSIEPVVAVAAVPVVSDSKPVEEKSEPAADVVIARTFKNENISFFLIEQGDQLVAYVNESKLEHYKKGELIGTFEKTSVPNFFRVSWKKKEQDIDETMAHFDDEGNLKIDIHRNGKIEVISFSEEK